MSINPLALGVAGVFTVMFGVPLYATKKILNTWYNTTAGKTLGMAASIGSLIAGYYTYLASLSPDIQKLLTDPSNANPWLGIFFIIWPVAILSGIWGGRIGKGWSKERLYWKANSAFKKRNYEEAVNFLNAAIKLRPKDADNYTLLAEAQRKNQHYIEAISAYQKALEINPNNSASHNNLGVVYAESADQKKAIESYKRSIELEPNDLVVLNNLATTLHSDGKLLEAAKVYQRHQQIKPTPEVTEKLNQILHQVGRLEKIKPSEKLPFLKTLGEIVPARSKWVGNAYGNYDEWGGGAFFIGLVAAGAFIWGAYSWHWWQIGTDKVSIVTQWTVWISSILSAQALANGGLYVIGKVVDVFITIKRFFGFPSDFRKVQNVNIKPSDELSDKELREVAPMYARMSKDYLEKIFRSWVEAGDEEKVSRLFKFGDWESDKTRIYGDIGEYKRLSRMAASKFSATVQEQKVIFDRIDAEKDRLAQKGINNAIGLIKDILPQIIEVSRSSDELFKWLNAIVELPQNTLQQGQRQILSTFNDLREYSKAQEDAMEKYLPFVKRKYVVLDIERLEKMMKSEGLNYPAILKRILPEITNVSQNFDEFTFWVSEVLRFEKQWFTSGGYSSLLQNLIAFQKAKESAIRKLATTDDQKTQLNQAVDSLRAEVYKKQPYGEVAILKDILPRVTEGSTTLVEFLEYIALLKSFDNRMWSTTLSVLTSFNNHVAYKQARENAAAKFAPEATARQKFLTDIDNLRAKLMAKGFPQASDLLKDILPELTKTCRNKEEFIHWMDQLVGLNNATWQRGAQAVINDFNALAGYQQAKEMAVTKLASTPQEKVDLIESIDSMKATLEAIVPSSAGFMKEVILEILKDIDVLAQPPHRKNDFLWYLGKVVNFELATWSRGSTGALAGYQEVKRYIQQKRTYFGKFTTNEEEQNRFLGVYAVLEKNSSFTRPAFIALLNNALEKISQFASTPRDFTFWVGTLSELKGEVLEAFCKDIDAVLAYAKQKGKNVNFNQLPNILNQLYKNNHQTVLLTPDLLDIITDSTLDNDKRAEKLARHLIEQKIVKLGGPQNLIGVVDPVSIDELIYNVARIDLKKDDPVDLKVGENTIRSFMSNHEPLKIAIKKMGREGIYTYAETQKPAYYRHFLEEAKGLKPGFNQPGEKFRVSYLDRKINLVKTEQVELFPISNNIETLRQLIQHLRNKWPNYYENLYDAKREKFNGRPMEDFVTTDSVSIMAKALLRKVVNWQLTEQERVGFVAKLIEIFVFQEATDLRTRIASASDEFSKLKLISQYWEKVLALSIENKWIQANSKYYKELLKVIKAKISSINEKIGDGGEGVLQFYLSGGTLADFFRGWVCVDCTRNESGDHDHFNDTQAWVMDPAAFKFKVMEKNKWIGNIYSFAFKDKDGKFYLYWDMFQVNLLHTIANNLSSERRLEMSSKVIKQLTEWLGSIGFDYLLISPTPAQHKIPEDIKAAIKRDYGIGNTERVNAKKLGGTEFFSEAGVHSEFVQTIEGNAISNSFQYISGYKININKTTSQALQHKRTDLDHLEKLLGEMVSEETRLARLKKERKEELNRINQKGMEAARAGQNTLTSVLKETSDQKAIEIQKIDYELNEIHVRMQEKKYEYKHLAVELGIGASDHAMITDSIMTIVWVGGVAGIVGLMYYVFNKIFPPDSSKEGSYYERNYYPPTRYEDLSLPDDLKIQQKQALEQVSAVNKELVPERLDVKIPLQIGIPKSQGIKALRALYTNLIQHKSLFEFFKTQDFYTDFKQKTKELGLADDFDQPKDKSYLFTVSKEEIRYEEDRRTEEFIGQYLKKLVEPKDTDHSAIQVAMRKQRKRIVSKEWFKGDPQEAFYSYYQLLLANTAFESKAKVEAINKQLGQKNPLGALNVLEEIYRIDIGGEQIALESDPNLVNALNKILQRELDDIHWQFNRSSAFQANKQQIIRDARDIQFELRLSERTADDILRGIASGDCTSINGGSAYYNTIPQFMFDPGLQVFRVLQEGKWVGNVYTIVTEKNGKPVLVVDAVQLPVWGRTWPVSVKELADKVLDKVVEYAKAQGFDQVVMSSFVSNFNAIHDHFEAKYKTTAQEIEKVGGFTHLVSLGLWDRYATRNEYLETYSPHWNYPLKRVDPNNPKQTLMLRTIWKSDLAQLMDSTTAESTPTSDQAMLSTFKKMALSLMVATPMFLSALTATAATFSHNSDGTLRVNVEQTDTFGQILLDAGYKAPLWGPNNVVAKLQNSVEKQISSHDINKIGPGTHFTIPDPQFVDPQVGGYMQDLSKAINGLKSTSRLFSTNDLKGLDQVLSNIPQTVLDNEQANKVIKEVQQARGEMDSTFFKINNKRANVDAKGFHSGDSQRFNFTPDGKKQLDLVWDINGHLKTAKSLMKPFQEKKNGIGLSLQGGLRLGPLTVKLAPEISVAPMDGKGPIGLSGNAKIAYGEDNTKVSQSTQPKPDAQKTIDNINGQLKSVKGEVEKLQQLHSGLEKENTDLKGKLGQAQQQVEQLKTTQQLPDSVTQLETKKVDLERQLTDIQRQQTQAKEDIKQSQAEKEKVSGEINTLRQQVPELAKQAQDLKGQAAELNSQKEKTQGEINELQTQKSTLEGNIHQLNQDKDILDQKLSGLKQQIEQAKGDLEKANVRSTPSFDNVWSNFSTWQKVGLFLVSLTGIGLLISGFIMWKKIKKYEEINGKVSDLQRQADELEAQLEPMRQEKQGLAQEIEEKKNQSAQLDQQRQEKEAEIQRITAQIEGLKTQNQTVQEEFNRAKEEKDRVLADLDTKISDLSRQATEKEAELTALEVKKQEASVIPVVEPPAVDPISDEDVTKTVEYLKGLPSKDMQQRLRSPKNHIKESIQFLHDELGLDIANGKGRSLLLRNIETLKEQKKYLQSLGLPLTVTNLASSKRGFAKKELKQIIKTPEWQELNTEERLSVVSHLYDVYGLRISWQNKDNDWYALLHYFDMPGEPINYTPRSIDFIQRYELVRFKKFQNTKQTTDRLTKIKEIVSELKVNDLLNTHTTKEGFDLYMVKPEVLNGQMEFDRQNYPLPKVNFDPLESAGEEPTEITEPDGSKVLAVEQETTTKLKEEIAALRLSIDALTQERIKKTSELEGALADLTKRNESLSGQISELEKNLENKKQELALQEQRTEALKEEGAGYEKTLTSLKQQIEYSQAEFLALEEQKNTARKQLEALQDTSKATAEMEVLNARLQEIQTNIEKAKEEWVTLNANKEKIEGEAAAFQIKKDELQREHDDLTLKLQELIKTISDLKQGALTSQESAFTQLNQQIQTFTSQRDKLVEQIAGLDRQKVDKERELTTLINETGSESRRIGEEVSKLRQELLSLQEQMVSQNATLQSQQQEVQAKKDEQSRLEERVKVLRTENNNLESERVNLNKDITRKHEEIEGIEKHVREVQSTLESQTQTNQQTLAGQEIEIEDIERRKNTLESEIATLDQQLIEKKQEALKTLVNLDSEQKRLTLEMGSLTPQWKDAKKAVEDANGKLVNIQKEKAKIELVVAELAEQEKVLREQVEKLQRQKTALEQEIKRGPKLEVIEPEVDELLKQARAVALKADSLYLNAQGKTRGVDTFVSLVKQESRIGNEGIIREQLEEILLKMGGIVLESGEINDQSKPKNLIVEFPGTGKLAKEPGIIVNAHMDIVLHSSPKKLRFSINERQFYHETKGSFGADDKAGVLVILEALRNLKERFWDKPTSNKDHRDRRRIVFILTAEEEDQWKGARYLTGYRSEIFKNIAFSLTSDGHINYEVDDYDNKFIVVAKKSDAEKKPFSDIKGIIDRIAVLKDRTVELTEHGLRLGDFEYFPKDANANLHIRSPYEQKPGHMDERVKVKNLIDYTDLWIGLLGYFASGLNPEDIIVKSANSPKGKGVFSPNDHINVNTVITQAQQERRGQLIWGNIAGWSDNRAKYTKDIGWVIASLKRYSTVKIPKLGKIDIPEILAESNIVLITPRANAPLGLIAKSKDSYQIAHNGLAQNSIYIDQYTFNQLQTFEVAVLLAHEAILLGAKKLADNKGIPWTEQLAKDVTKIADDYEIGIVGKSDKGNGSRFDDRIVEILELNKPTAPPTPSVQPRPVVEIKSDRPKPYTPLAPELKPQPKPQPKTQESNGKFNLDFPDTKDNVLDGLRKLFWDSMFRDTASNLLVKWEGFPPPIAREIKDAYGLGKIKGMPLDGDLLALLSLFFSRIFPNHANSLINYLKTLHIFIIDNNQSTFGATLDGNTFYIQKSLFEDLLKRSMTVDEINQLIKNKNKQLLVALFRIIIHEIGAAFYKTSHEANQDLEKIFMGLLSKTPVDLPSTTQEEIRRINSTVNLDSLARLDWALKEKIFLDHVEIKFTGSDMFSLSQETISKLVNSLYSPNQTVRNNTAQALVRFNAVQALPYLRLLKDKEPDNQIVTKSVEDLGGIDLNEINIKRTGNLINVEFDPAQLIEIEKGGFEGFTPVITNIIRIENPLLLLGLNKIKFFTKNIKVQKESKTL